MTFEELGNILRIGREKQGLSIEDVANRLKISARVLRAVEAADMASLPHCVYVRGFVMSYARLLDLDTAELLSVEELYDPSEDPSSQDPQLVSVRKPLGRGTVIFILLLCLCLAGGGLAWVYRDADLFSKIKTDHLTTAQPAPSATMPEKSELPKEVEEVKPKTSSEVQEVKPVEQAVNIENKEQSNEVEQVARPVNQEATNITLQEDAPEEDTVTINTEQENVSQSQGSNTEASSAGQALALDGPNRVIITAVAECWVHSIADDSDTRQFSLRSGDTFALTFSDTLTLKLGNAGGVRIRYNGEETPVPGRDGEVKTITFPMAQ